MGEEKKTKTFYELNILFNTLKMIDVIDMVEKRAATSSQRWIQNKRIH